MPKGDFGGKRNANGLDKNPQNINKKGRPKKLYTVLKESGYSKDDIRAAFMDIGHSTEAEARKVLEDEDQDLIYQVVCKAFLEAKSKGDYKLIREIMDVVLTGSSGTQQNIQINFLDSF